MKSFTFDLQRFYTVAIAAGESQTFDGVTYTAISDAVLNLDDSGKVSGIASGKVSAVVTGASDSPTLTLDATEKALAFTLTAEDGALVATNTYGRERTITLTEGTLSIEGYDIVAGAGSTFTLSLTSSGMSYTFVSEKVATYSVNDDGFSVESEHSTATVSIGGQTLFSLELYGKMSEIVKDGIFHLSNGTTVSYTFSDGSVWSVTSNSDDSGSISFTNNVLQIIPTAEGSLSINVSNDENNYVNFANITGTVSFGGAGLTLSNGSTFSGEWSINGIKKTISFVAEGGTATITFANDGSITSAASDGATITINLDDRQMIVHSGSVTDNIADSTLSLPAGSAIEVDGVTYTALDGAAVLKHDDNRKISGLASGKVSAVVAGAESSPTLTLDATDGSTDFTLTGNGEVLTLTKVLPFELDNGTFTLAGNVLTAAKGSDLEIGKGRTYADGTTVFGHDYANTDITYTITDTTLTEETDRETITFTATLGDRSRSITTFVNGKIINGVADGKFTGGLTFTKDSSMGLVLGDYTIKATANADATSQVMVNSEGINITPGSGDGKLNVALSRADKTIFGGELECTNGTITFGYDQAVTFTQGTSFNFTWNNYVSTITATGDATTAIALTDNGIEFTPGSGDGGLNLLLTKDGKTVFGGTLNISDGSITFNSDEKKFSFTEGTKISLGIGADGSRAMDFEIVDKDASFKMEANTDGSFTITPDSGDGSLAIALKQNGETVFQNTVSVNGSMIINPVTDLITLTNGTTVSLAFDNYTITATADGDAASKISLTEQGISITPQQGDGTLNLTLGRADGSMSVDVEILSGGFLFGTSGALSVTEGTELQLKFSDDYIVNFKATDTAGGALSIGADGLTFAPNAEDGGLELSVTRNGVTRTTTLDVTGSLTYKLDGSISLTKDTVVKNVFEDGNILTITANTDASGSIVFTPDTGITITPAEPTALNVLFSGGGGEVEVFNITSIDGSINYKGGIITASDGTEVLFTNYYMESEMKLSTDGGSSSLEITEDSTAYIANEGATFVLDYQDGTTLEITEGTFIDDYEHAIITAGSTFKTNDDEDYFYLQTAGNYNLNGMNVTTTLDNVPIILGEDSIILDTLTYTPLDENVTLTIGENSIACAGGKANVAMSLLGMAFDFDATSGSFTFDRTNSTFSIEAGTVISMTQGDSELQLTALEDTSATLRLLSETGVIYCDWADTTKSTLSIVRDGQTVIALPFSLTGTTSYLPSTGTFALVYNKDNSTNATATIGLANYEIQLTTPDKTFIVGLETSDDGKVTVNYPREEYSTMNLVITRDDNAIFGGALSVDGSVVFDPTNRTLTLKDGTSTEMAFSGYTLKATANGDATSAFAIVDEGLVITPNTGDGTLQLEIGTGTASMTAELEVLSGSFTLKQGGALTVAKDTEMQLTFSDDYSVKFKTTDAAGGNLSLGTDGLTFTPGTDDGSLKLSVTRDGVTNTTLLDMTGGSVTYKLDGSISLAEGTVVKNTFEDGRVLTVTANTDAGNSMVFTPQNGLIITPATPDALSVLLSADGTDIIKLASIDGTVNYSGGTFTASDGTEIRFVDPAGNYNDNVLRTKGGTTSLSFSINCIIYAANEGATFTMDYLQGTTWELQNGAITDYFSGKTQGLLSLSEGATFDTNDNEYPFALGETGNYTLNGMNVTTTKDNVQAVLSNYDTVIVDGISYTPLDENVTLTIGENITTCTGGKVSMQMDGISKSLTFDTNDGSISYDSSSNAYLISTAEDLVALAERVNGGDDCKGVTFKLTNDIDMSSIANFTPIGNYTSQSDYNAFNGTFDGGGYTISNLTINHPDDTNQALFGNVDYGATIINLNIVNAKVTGYKDVGGVVGWHGGNLVNCTVSNSTIESKEEDVGGIAGDNEGAVNSCRAINTTVIGKYSVGGLVGDNDGVLGNSYVISPTVTTVSSDVDSVGAVAGDNSGTVEAHCYDIGSLARIGKNTGTDSGKEITDLTEIPGGIENVQLSAGKFIVTAGTAVIVTQDEQVITVTATEEASATYKIEGGIYYFNLGNDATAKVSIAGDEQTVFKGNLEIGGVFSYNPETGTFGLTGANSSHGSGKNTFAEFVDKGYGIKMATSDTTVVFIPKINDGKLELNFPNERKHAMAFTVSKDDQTIFENNLVIDGTVSFDPAAQELSLTKDTVLSLVREDGNTLEITALDDAGGKLTVVDSGIRFAPNENDGALELNFVSANRKANLNVTGAVVLGAQGKISLEDGTEVNLTWEGGTNLKLNSHGSTGSVVFGEKGIRIAGEDENLDMTLTTPDGYLTTISSIQGSVWYNAGTVTLDADTFITGKNIVEGRTVGIKVEAIGGDASLHFSNVGFTYSASDGKTRVTYTLGEAESSFTLNKGSVYIQGRVLNIAEGSDLSTDFKDFIPAQYFRTQEAGTYTINGQTITTSAEGLALTATDDYMVFTTSDDNAVEYDGMNFAGAGNVSLTADNFVLGAGVEATGFGEGNSFVLAEAGNVTVDGKVFELIEDIPLGITVTGAEEGFTFASTLTEEAVQRADKDESLVGKVFTEYFTSNDNTYRVQAELRGLLEVNGISGGTTMTGGADLDGTANKHKVYVVTESDGTFTVADKTYTIAGDSEVTIETYFDTDDTGAAIAFDGLSGTVSGDFTAQVVSINGGSALQVLGDSSIDIVPGDNGAELFGVSGGATLANLGGVSKVHTDTEGVFTFGATENDSIAISVQGDDNVTFEIDDEQSITAITNIEGNLIFSETNAYLSINGISGTFSGEFSSIGAYSGALYIHDAQDGSALVTGNEDKIWLQMLGASFALNDNDLTLTNDADGIWIRDKEIVGLDAGARLQVSAAGTYKVNGINFNAKAGDYINAGKGGYDIIDDFTSDEIVTVTSSGNQDIDLGKADYEVAYIKAEATGNKNVTLGGGNLAVVEDTDAKVNITASKGNDTIISEGKKVFVNLLGGKTDIFELEGKMNISGYNASTGSGFHTGHEDILTAIVDDAIDFDKGKLTIASAVVDFDTDSLLINFFDSNDELQKVGYVSSDESLNLSAEKADLILLAEENSTITGGAGDDTIYADAGSHVDAGAGKNYIEIETRNANDDGSIINVINGNNTIANFNAGFDDSSDVIENSSKYWDNKFDGTDIIIKTDSGKAVISNVGSGEEFMKFKQSANGYEYKVALAQKNSVITVDSDDIANVYRGEKSGVDFTGFEDSLLVNLNESAEGKVVDESIYFYGINQVTMGGGLNTLISSAQNETLTGNADGMTQFIFEAGAGHDVIQNFNFAEDRISVGSSVSNVVLKKSGDVIVQLGEEWITLEDARGKNFIINDVVAKVDENISYDDTANYFLATSRKASLTVEEEAEIWLDGSHGKTFVGNIKTLDASNSDGRNTLAGNDLDNTIFAGKGDASLWGGNVGDDLLFGGAGKNMFFYALGNGNDTASGTNDGDIVYLSGITLEQITGTSFTDGAVNVKFSDGGQLTVNDDGKAVDFVVGEQTFRVNSEHTAFTTEINA